MNANLSGEGVILIYLKFFIVRSKTHLFATRVHKRLILIELREIFLHPIPFCLLHPTQLKVTVILKDNTSHNYKEKELFVNITLYLHYEMFSIHHLD